MGVLTASKPWPMSPPLNPSDFPGSNPHAVQATLITNYLRETPADQYGAASSSSPSSSQLEQQPQDLSQYMRRMTLGNSHNHHHRGSIMMKSGQPLYESVRPKSTSFDEDPFKMLKAAGSSIRVENDYQLHPLHYRQRSDGGNSPVRRPQVPPPLPPSNPRPPFMSMDDDDSTLTRAQAHLLAQPSTPTCVPWLKKVKVIKNIKRKIGIGGLKNGTCFNNLPPLNFHHVHGDNVHIFQEGTVARRINSFCKAIVFSNRSVKVNEKVSIRLIELSNNWSGVLRFGFTNVDPSTLRNNLPKYVCPDLTSRPGFWAKAFDDKLKVKKDTILNFHVNSSGEIHFSIDGEEKGIFLADVDTRLPLWAVMDIYGNTTAVELVDSRAHLNNSRRSLQTEPSPVCAAKFHHHQQQESHSSPSRCQQIPLKAFQHTPPPPQIPSQTENSSYQMMPSCHSARSLPDSQLYSSGTQSASRAAHVARKPTVSTSYLPVPHKAPTDVYSSRGCQPSSPVGCSASSSSSTSGSNRPSLPVYKTPPMPKSCTDYYEPIVRSKMSVKPGPSTMTNYVSISSLKARGDCSAQGSSSFKAIGATSVTCTPPKESPSMSLECLACCERPVDSVFYSCGHMCMCYQCAVEYWRTKEKGHCPICRSAINDVIRTYT